MYFYWSLNEGVKKSILDYNKIVLFSSIGKTNYQNITKTLFKKLLNSQNPKENIQAKFTFKWTSGYKK